MPCDPITIHLWYLNRIAGLFYHIGAVTHCMFWASYCPLQQTASLQEWVKLGVPSILLLLVGQNERLANYLGLN